MKKNSPWSWIPSLYFAEGIPYVMVMTVSVIMYKRLDISNADIAFYTSWLYLPWVIKPFWSPFVDLLKTKKWWILSMQLLLGAGLAGIAFLLPLNNFFQSTLAVFWLLAFSSATHDIAADGFYLIALKEHEQSYFVGIRSTFYRLAMISGQGLLVILAGSLEKTSSSLPMAWSLTFFVVAAVFLMFYLYHKFVLPKAEIINDAKSLTGPKQIFAEFLHTFKTFFQKKHIVVALLFLLVYRLGESMLVKMASPFLLDAKGTGGLGLSTEQLGLTYGTIGVIALTLGGILGGIAIATKGLKYWIFPMGLAITLPNLVYVYLSYFRPDSFLIVNIAVAIEQFGYGFGFTAYMMFMMMLAQGKQQTAHYAFTTGFMALGMMLPGMMAGWMQESVGYPMFFVIVVLCAIPTLAVIPFLRIDKEFGRK